MRSLRKLAFLAFAPAACAQLVTLAPVTVSATRSPADGSAVPFTVETVDAAAFGDASQATIDGTLRALPDFSLFRRNDSQTANPTSQGVSLRGLGPSGASRSLVLLDGVPLNDPFGGWVSWSSVPADLVSGAQVVPSGGATAWGNEALAGVIELFTVHGAPGEGLADLRVADFGTQGLFLMQSLAAGPGTLTLSGSTFASTGTGLIAPGQRGPVDVDAWSRHATARATWSGPVSKAVTATATLRTFDEDRGNGTPDQTNRTRQAVGSVDLSGSPLPELSWDAVAYAEGEDFSQTFSSVNASRTAETLASRQFGVPASSEAVSFTATWREVPETATTAGTDLRAVRGETREDYAFSKGAFTDERFAGGSQSFGGLFAEQSCSLGFGLEALGGVRVDHWALTQGHLRDYGLATGAPIDATLYPDRAGTELSPSAGITWKPAQALSLHVSAERSFRVPTLNELYRPFRLGTTQTLANPALSPEHATSGEIGASWSRPGFTLALTGFAARLEDPVANVTLAQGPGTFPLFGTLPAGGVGQERLNLGRVDTRGAELALRWIASSVWSMEISGQAENATVGAAAVAPGLVGKRLAEVPRWNASAGVTWHPHRLLFAAARVRSNGSQFDDDLNTLPLGSATVLDGDVRVLLGSHAEVTVFVDNALDANVETAHSALGVYSVAPPRTAGLDVRLSW